MPIEKDSEHYPNCTHFGPAEAKSQMLHDVGLCMRTGHIARKFETNFQESPQTKPVNTILYVGNDDSRPDRTYIGDFGIGVILASISASLYFKGKEIDTQGLGSFATYIYAILLGAAALKGTTHGIGTLIRLKRRSNQS